ncbi:hypothetical protein E8E13_006399 [Curvularia kusanoi]|uniref:Uncharacterized protein n=1 Tax=Curvularia kusanoi TaxID=90978 RepID=A0A9P4W8R6_CURKU|nr:hypothetical protein E8E13_006399 [Curvularia kusanoi]
MEYRRVRPSERFRSPDRYDRRSPPPQDYRRSSRLRSPMQSRSHVDRDFSQFNPNFIDPNDVDANVADPNVVDHNVVDHSLLNMDFPNMDFPDLNFLDPPDPAIFLGVDSVTTQRPSTTEMAAVHANTVITRPNNVAVPAITVITEPNNANPGATGLISNVILERSEFVRKRLRGLETACPFVIRASIELMVDGCCLIVQPDGLIRVNGVVEFIWGTRLRLEEVRLHKQGRKVKNAWCIDMAVIKEYCAAHGFGGLATYIADLTHKDSAKCKATRSLVRACQQPFQVDATGRQHCEKRMAKSETIRNTLRQVHICWACKEVKCLSGDLPAHQCPNRIVEDLC